MSYRIQFFSENTTFVLKNKVEVRKWLTNTITEERKKPWYINIVFCSDDYLFELNKTYLHHDTFTDILTFPFDEDDITISGDIFISIERVRENAIRFKQKFEIELYRVMVHGILHLLGFSDKGVRNKKRMTEKENYYLEKLELTKIFFLKGL